MSRDAHRCDALRAPKFGICVSWRRSLERGRVWIVAASDANHHLLAKLAPGKCFTALHDA